MVQFGSPGRETLTPGAPRELSIPNRKVAHGQAMRDMRQRAAVRTPRQSRQEPGQPEVHAQPADGPCDGGGTVGSGARLHAMPSHLLGVNGGSSTRTYAA